MLLDIVPFGALEVMAAGERAVSRWLAESGLWTPGRAWAADAGAAHDQAWAREVATDAGSPLRYGDGAAYDWWAAGARADTAFTRRWQDVLDLAEAIDARSRLTADEVRAITGL